MKPYQTGNWKAIVKTEQSAPLAVHFWGVTCPACVKEMPQWGQFIKNNPGTKIIFIQVDDVSQEVIKKMLSKAGLDNANNYYVVAPFDERLRYEIDPQWHGETPTTILIDSKGRTSRKTGLIDFKQLKTILLL
ncbi:TlpA family protein disulfide reductase [Polynucleobacter necessarius]|uniref:TlpA family protein disulfide reductase n=1 Tax=Polynucleobacter necessarius TaxID=576610 RepID=UPI0013B04BBC|nr:TlpA disulfide reductase family protein [Polynucleobacter necessarius]